jgi:gamma-glutamyltranspeptidase / glutathione hydrolase
MKGAVAAGHPITAEVGARILQEGGNAFDACVAAAFASWITESPLTGPGAGGFLLAHRPGGDSEPPDRVLDFFVAAPGRGLAPDEGEAMEDVEVPFDQEATQVFRIGAAACAVPGAVAGLAEAHRLYGTLPWADLVKPAADLARDGVELTRAQAYLHTVLDAVLRRTPDIRRVYGANGRLAAGDRLVMPELAATLEALGRDGADAFYRGELARRISEHVRREGGRLTEDDLAEYRVVRRRPLRAGYLGHVFVSNPPPSSGGLLIAFALRVLDELGRDDRFGTANAISSLSDVMREATQARAGTFATELHRGGLPQRLLAESRVRETAERVASRRRERAAEPIGLPSTTHVSVVDAEGNAASLSASLGCGSAVVVPETGVHLNNMLGETDLNPSGRTAPPGRRLSSMMAPSLVLRGDRPRLVVGSAGSVRLRGAILQIVVNVVAHGMTAEEAVEAPRVHMDGENLHLEGGADPAAAEALERWGYEVIRWRRRNLYFGGVSAVAVGERGELQAAGDPRRGGAGVVVA